MGSARGTQSLTNREWDIIRLLFEGSTNREMGEMLGVSWMTVRNHISRLLVKFEARNRTELLARLVALRRSRHRQLIP
jgi:DNA-binding NarL/FixJ family response regulator